MIPMKPAARQENATSSLYLFLIIVLGFVVYANVLGGRFIWDDDLYIKSNAHIRSLSFLPQLFLERVGEGYMGVTPQGDFYRPLQMVVYTLGYAFWGLQPLGYHLVNVFLHIAVALCLFRLLEKIFLDRALAWLTALFYVVHPAHAEVIANMTGTAEPLVALFLLLAFLSYMKADSGLNAFSCVATLFYFFAALLSKESAIVFPLVLLLYHAVLKKAVKPILFFSVISVAIFHISIRMAVFGALPIQSDNFGLIFSRIPGFFVAFASYIRILFFPVDLHVHYGDITFRFFDARVLSGILLFFALLYYAARNRNKDPLFFFALGWFLIFLLPVSNIYRINDSFMKEHWLYLPSMGFFLVLSRIFLRWHARPKREFFGALGIAATMIFFSFCTIDLNAYWKEPLIFLNRSIRYRPDYAVFYNELGYEYQALGRFEEAAEFFQKALQKNPGLVEIYSSLGVVRQRSGRYPEAIEAYQAALKINPEDLVKYYLIAECYEKMGRKNESENIRRQVREQSLVFAQRYRAEGEKFRRSGRLKDAVLAYRKSLSFFPQDISLRNELGCLYVLRGDFKEALKLFRQAMAMDPSNAVVHNNLALAYYYTKQYDLAIRHCGEALRLGYRVDPKLLGWLEPYRRRQPGN